jgi:protein tyrosine kinase modulator
MLQRQTFHGPPADGDLGPSLSLEYILGVVKRRALFFAIPFLVVLTLGSLIAVFWPSRYLSQGTILVVSQEIPSDLVRPTIAALANDRIQVIEQRVMTRDNLLTVAKKYHIASGWIERVSGTEIVDFIRKRTVIKPSEQNLGSKRKQSVAFTVGFEYERPDVAAKVANELVTMLLSEDVRSRTEFAAQTTRFLGQEVTRLEHRLTEVDGQIIALRNSRADSTELDPTKALAALQSELVIKSATYSASHPDIQALKRKIAELKKTAVKTPPSASSTTDGETPVTTPGLDTLQAQRESLLQELSRASQKFSAARLGESLEKGQHSERLEVIEQPTTSYTPVSPNRKKLFILAVALALASGGGVAFAAEMLNQSIRTSTDLSYLIDRQLIVAIPYILTHQETQRSQSKSKMTIGLVTGGVLVGIFLLYYFVLPPIDLLFDKAMTLFK